MAVYRPPLFYRLVVFAAGDITCEPPNNVLSKFEGKLDWNGEIYALDNEKILLRGTDSRTCLFSVLNRLVCVA